MSRGETRVAIAIDIGGTKIAGGLVTDSGELVGDLRRISTPRGADAIIAAVVGLALELRATSPTAIAAVGIGSAGTISAEGVVVAATDAIPGWAGTALADLVAAGTGLPTTAINDVQAAAVGESRLGHLRGVTSGLLVAVGTGVGGAYVAPSGVVTGRYGRAGSVGHIEIAGGDGRRCGCGAIDHVEPYASGPAMEQAYARATGVELDLVAIAARAEAGDPVADEVLTAGAAVLGAGLASMSQALDPHVIVLGGGVVEIGERYVDAVTRAYRAASVPPSSAAPVRTARLGGSTVVVGAGLHALDATSRA